jgi:hypothetical protein
LSAGSVAGIEETASKQWDAGSLEIFATDRSELGDRLFPIFES